jgi:hypothetical protein
MTRFSLRRHLGDVIPAGRKRTRKSHSPVEHIITRVLAHELPPAPGTDQCTLMPVPHLSQPARKRQESGDLQPRTTVPAAGALAPVSPSAHDSVNTIPNGLRFAVPRPRPGGALVATMAPGGTSRPRVERHAVGRVLVDGSWQVRADTGRVLRRSPGGTPAGAGGSPPGGRHITAGRARDHVPPPDGWPLALSGRA